MKKALVLSGGSIKGAFQAGAIAELLRAGTLKPQGIFGISTGALNAAFLADRAGRQLKSSNQIDWPSIGNELEQFWIRRVTKPSDLVTKKSYIFEAIFGNFKGLLNTDPLKSILEAEIKVENLERYSSAKDKCFSVGAVDLYSGEILYTEAKTDHLIDFIFASAAMPFAFPEVRIAAYSKEPSPFVDGGVRDLTPLRRAIDKGYDEITVIMCQPETYIGNVFNTGNVIKTAERLIDILLAEAMENDLHTVVEFKKIAAEYSMKNSDSLARYGKVARPIIIRPGAMEPKLDVDITSFTSKHISDMICLGRQTVNPSAGCDDIANL